MSIHVEVGKDGICRLCIYCTFFYFNAVNKNVLVVSVFCGFCQLYCSLKY